LAAIPDTLISGRRVARELTTLVERRDKPGMIVSDNGIELTSNAILAWSKDHKVEWHYIAPGRPMQDDYVGILNGRMRDQLLNESLFFGLDHARSHCGKGRPLRQFPASFIARIPADYAGIIAATGPRHPCSSRVVHNWAILAGRRVARLKLSPELRT
jgi:transposase InsO family protein